MSQEQRRLASFCRLCLTKTKDKVPIFGKEEANVINLLLLIELDVDPDLEPDAIVCYDCIVTLEGFFMFKEQCHDNDEYLKTIAPQGGDVSEVSSEYDGEEPCVVDVGSEEETPEEKPTPKRKHSAPAKNRPKKPKLPGKPQPSQDATLKPDLDRLKLERECQKFKVRRRIDGGPTLEEMQVLQDSYPNFFHFEKNHRSQHYTLVYYGERFNSANFSERYSYWKCAHRRKYKCKAIVVAWNSYLRFERRYEHSHGAIKHHDESVVRYSPRQALPEVFKICRDSFKQYQARRRKALLEKKKLQQSLRAGVGSSDSEEEGED